MQVLVTGGAGFVGSHVVRLLLERGDHVRVMAHRPDACSNLNGLRVEVVQGDLVDSSSLGRAVDGCQEVYHCAADYRLWTRQPDELYRANVDGTDSLLQACRRSGVEKVVYTSSVAAIGLPKDGRPGDEDTPVSLGDMVGHYKRSKFLAQQVALQHAAEGYAVFIVNPSTPVGPGDVKPTATGKIILDFLRGRMPAYVDTGLNLVAVEDVARGHLLAAERGIPGRLYILGDQDLTLRSILEMLAKITGLPAPRFQLPHSLVYWIACIENFFSATLLRREPMIPLEGVKMARKKMFFSSHRARRELGFETGSAYAALERSVRWFIAHGYAGGPRGDAQRPPGSTFAAPRRDRAEEDGRD